MKTNYILSFKAAKIPSLFQFVHDPSAVLAKNGKIIAGVEEERLIGIKHAANIFPFQSIKFCLNKGGIDFSDINKIIIPDDPDFFRKDYFRFRNLKILKYRYFIKKKYSQQISHNNSLLKHIASSKECTQIIISKLRDYFGERKYPPIEYMNHHLCHAASAYYPSGFSDATIITIDGSGDFDATVIWSVIDNKLHREVDYKLDNSLGHFFGAFTVFLGYKFCNGESKIMGLAPYGKKNQKIFSIFDEIILTNEEKYDVRQITIPFLIKPSIAIKRIEDLFGIKRRLPNENFKEEHKDLAYALQHYLEKIAVNLTRQAIRLTGSHNVCISGGVALNCKMNKKIMEMPEVDNIFIQPVAHDAGGPLGAVLEASHQDGFNVKYLMDNNYFGPQFEDSIINKILQQSKICFNKINNYKSIAQALADGKFIAWFQGKMEMGPRALGNRSILCDPRRNDLKDHLNEFIKHRENWRPYAPSILEDYAIEYIENYSSAPFMIKTFNVKENHIKEIEGVLHPVDKTTRPHVVSKKTNPRFYNLIREFWRITNIPLLLNTSFNDHGKPIVCTPKDALQMFYSSGLDILVLHDYVVTKEI